MSRLFLFVSLFGFCRVLEKDEDDEERKLLRATFEQIELRTDYDPTSNSSSFPQGVWFSAGLGKVDEII